jgi:putative ABC transport system ATP-binding protein
MIVNIKSEIDKRVRDMAEKLGISALLSKYPKELSGGEAQRTAIARAVIAKPKLILADEPTGALDEENGSKIMQVFRKLHDQGNTIVIVTHDPGIAAMCERTVWIKDGKNQTT